MPADKSATLISAVNEVLENSGFDNKGVEIMSELNEGRLLSSPRQIQGYNLTFMSSLNTYMLLLLLYSLLLLLIYC